MPFYKRETEFKYILFKWEIPDLFIKSKYLNKDGYFT